MTITNDMYKCMSSLFNCIFNKKPGIGFVNKVSRLLVEKYPFMSDSSDSQDALSYVSQICMNVCLFFKYLKKKL